MMKALVMFGSKSDADVYKKIASELKRHKVQVDLRVLSAHRTPDEVDKAIQKDDFDVVIAGAGLSAALPGVIAAKTLKPVIGVPVHNNYSGLDALLSCMQMPPGIPVLTVGVNQAEIAAQQASAMGKGLSRIILIGDKREKAVEKAAATLERLGVEFTYADAPADDAINIVFTYFDEPLAPKEELVIYCPLLPKKDDTAEAALNILEHSSHGLWVGLNRGENAAIAAAEILGDCTDKLWELRQESKKEVLAADKEAQK
ncbi:MAG TPA: AIR carboxylase family protein [Candidatus Nanoarchaeia archaeon]|nr:AIR carboxylase family protein [Candidatus Nanoarchaeia archaeon]